MPIYEYHCSNCGYTFEVLQKISDNPVTECTRCASAVRRLLSAPALVFKGGGWYVNDFPTQDRKKGIDSEKGNGDGAVKKSQQEAKTPLQESPKAS